MRARFGRSAWAILIGGAAALAVVFCVVLADELEPPGAPGNTFEHQIRAADLPMTITTPGSYHLSEDINTAGGGITISASSVTIDLMGFTLDGGTGDGVFASAGTKNITVKNGTVRGWATDGVDLNNATNSQVVHVLAEGNGTAGGALDGDGIRIGNGGLVSGCTSSGNDGDGIQANGASTIISSTASSNLGTGITGGSGCTITDCAVYLNTSTGITAGFANIVKNCSVYNNNGDGISLNSGASATHCTVYSNGDAAGDDGIVASGGNTVTECTTRSNFEDGIEVASNSYVARNMSSSNNTGVTVKGTGIRYTGSDTRIEENNVTNNYDGIAGTTAGNFIIRNSASGNTNVNYDLGTNSFGTITVLGPGSFSNTNSYANFEY